MYKTFTVAAQEAEKLRKTKWKLFCETPCIIFPLYFSPGPSHKLTYAILKQKFPDYSSIVWRDGQGGFGDVCFRMIEQAWIGGIDSYYIVTVNACHFTERFSRKID